jgi:hypothetical protein
MWFWHWWSFGKNDIPLNMLRVTPVKYTWFRYLAWWNLNYISWYEIGYPNSHDYIKVDDNCNETYEKTIKVPEKKTIHEYKIFDWNELLTQKYYKTVKWIEPIYPEVKVDWINSKKTNKVNYERDLKIRYKSSIKSNKHEHITIDYSEAKQLLNIPEKIKCKMSLFNLIFRTKTKIKDCLLNYK